jgi:hypothetical protein
MKTAIERFVDWLQEYHPQSVPSPEVLAHLKMLERMDQQLAYNAGFANAKKIYNEADNLANNIQKV